MLKRSILCALAATALLVGAKTGAQAVVASPALGTAADVLASTEQVRWVCGPYRCAYLPGYAGPVVVRPYMRRWVPPPRPYCHYVRGPAGRWALVCP
jgi:hypothetical protein